VLSVDRLSGGEHTWEIALYFDAPLASSQAIHSATDGLAAVASKLVSLGRVEVVFSDALLEVLAAGTEDEGELRQALTEVASLSESGGEMLRARRRFLDDIEGESPAVRRSLALDAHRLEEELIQWQRDALLGWLAQERPAAPRALFLVMDGFDLRGDHFFKQAIVDTGDRQPLPSSSGTRSRQEELTRTLAAEGWAVYPLLMRKPAAELDDPQGLLETLADETGGALITSAGALAEETRRLGERFRVRYSGAASLDGRPRPLELRPLRGDLQLRGPRWSTSATPQALAAARARGVFEEETRGGLVVESAVLPGASPDQDEIATLEAVLHLDPTLLPDIETSATLRVTLLFAELDALPTVLHRRGAGADLSAARRWVYTATLELSHQVEEVVVVIEELATGRWGGTVAEFATRSIAPVGTGVVAEAADLTPPPPDTPTSSARSSFLRLVPPRGLALTGPQRFRTLVTSEAVRSVGFYLDGEQVVVDEKPPFTARIDLGPEAIPRTVEAVAMDRSGRHLGRDSIDVNRRARPAGVRLTEVSRQPGSDVVEVTAEVTLAPGQALLRVEFYRNQVLVSALESPPFAARLPGPAGVSTDFVRVVAHYEDGTSLEDVELLDAPGAVERVEVNLVELYVVVLDGAGRPIQDLDESSFTIRQDGREREIERFAIAEETPLVLGLVVDTSESMDTLMPDTKRAAVRFLGDTVSPLDRAFLVDFDDRPRLAHATTDDVFTLVSSLGSLRADGFTALYDSIVFSMTQFEEGLGRKALVVLSDGDDVKSQFSYRQTYKRAASGGIPVYMIALGGLDELRGYFRKVDLEAIAEASGGRVFYVSSPDELSSAYAQIGAELRSQYVLAYATDHQLREEEIRSIEVTVEGRDRRVRTVVGRPSGL
jgi:Ca-activated chloride channel family protein